MPRFEKSGKASREAQTENCEDREYVAQTLESIIGNFGGIRKRTQKVQQHE